MKRRSFVYFISGIIPLIFLSFNCIKEDLNPVKYKLLFVGNSLTYTNDLPFLVKNRAKQKGVEITTEMLAHPDYGLHDHWANGVLQDKINNNNYDYVIMQQGPSSQEEGKKILLEYGHKIAELCKSNNTKPAFYMVWPAHANYNNFNGVIANYTLAAEQNEAILCPVGMVWKNHIDSTADLSFYGPDLFHPSLSGSEKAAEIIVNSLFGI